MNSYWYILSGFKLYTNFKVYLTLRSFQMKRHPSLKVNQPQGKLLKKKNPYNCLKFKQKTYKTAFQRLSPKIFCSC